MAELQQMQVNEINEEENISLEKQAAMQEEAAQQRNQTLEADPKAGKETIEEQLKEEEPADSERPEWLDEKFESPEEMAKAYKELQKKMSEPKPAKKTTAKKDAEPEVAPTEVMSEAIDSATNEFSENGELSDKTFEALEQAGLPRHFVEAYINGQQAVSVQQASAIQESIGGEGNYSAMSEWATENLTDSELDAFNSIVEGSSVDAAKVAVKGLYSQFLAAGGKGPSLVQGSTTGEAGAKPFGSAAQLTEAMRDKRYETDPAYREQIEKRLAVSTIF
jgi:hypothetical protein